MADLVSYNDKHNLANGEDNNDGENHNNSWNCGQVRIDACDINRIALLCEKPTITWVFCPLRVNLFLFSSFSTNGEWEGLKSLPFKTLVLSL